MICAQRIEIFCVLPAIAALGGCYSLVWPDCPTNEEDKFFVDPTTEPFDVDGDDRCLPTELLLDCSPSWCAGVEDTGIYTWYCVDAARVRAWADEHDYVLIKGNDEYPYTVRPRCSSHQP